MYSAAGREYWTDIAMHLGTKIDSLHISGGNQKGKSIVTPSDYMH
jgi:hypothetical protein